MKKRTSIDRSIRWITAFIAFVIAIVTSLSAHVSLKEERDFWHKQTADNYRVQISSILNQEFISLSDDLEYYASSNITYGFVKFDREANLHRMFANQQLRKRDLSSIMIIGQAGENTFSNTLISPRLDGLIQDMFLPIAGLPYKALEDYGLVFVEGRIFLYQLKLIRNRAGVANKGSIVGFREVDSEMLEQRSSDMGLEFSIQYTSAGKRLVKVSYKQEIKVETSEIKQSDDYMMFEYRVKYSGDQVQPASFGMYAPLNDGLPSQFILPTAIFIFILGTVLSVWLIIRHFVIQPSLDFARLVTKSDHFSSAEKIEKKLPLELDLVYNQFKSLYNDVERQNRFSEQLLEAMGDVIITINIEGDIEYANPAAVKWFGFSEAHLVGEPLEMYINSRNQRDSGVANWIYKANIEKERIETTAKLTVLGKNEECFDCDVICQPVDLSHSSQYQSSAVVVIRPNSSKPCDVISCGGSRQPSC